MRNHVAVLVALFLVATAAGCKDSTDTASSTVTPSLTVSPAPNAMHVARGDAIGLMVDRALDTASCRARFTLRVGDSTGALVPGRMQFGDGYRQMMFVPDAPLQAGTRYVAHMRDSVMVGNGMGGMGMMGGTAMMGGQNQMMVMMFTQMPAGAMRMGDGMGWYFTTGD
jgi:hypothetical protein